MSNTARKPLSAAAVRAIAIRRAIAKRNAQTKAANDNTAPRERKMSTGLLAACIAAGGFDQNERFA